MFSEVKPKECQVEAAHEVATEWYSGYRLVWPKVDGSRNTTPWQPCAPPQPQHSLGFTLLIFILFLLYMHVLPREKKMGCARTYIYARTATCTPWNPHSDSEKNLMCQMKISY
jgi:hypothetical protein